MSRLERRLEQIFSRIERVVFRREADSIELLKQSVHEQGLTLNESYLRKVADIYVESMRTLFGQFAKQYSKAVKIMGGSYIELESMLYANMKERASKYIDRFNVFFLDSEADPEKYSQAYMTIMDEVNAASHQLLADAIEAMGEHIDRERLKKRLSKVPYVIWTILICVGIFYLFKLGLNSNWEIGIMASRDMNAMIGEVEQLMEDKEFVNALKESEQLLQMINPENEKYDYAKVKKMRGDIYEDLSKIVDDTETSKQFLKMAAKIYEELTEVITPEDSPKKSAKFLNKMGELCLSIPEVTHDGPGLSEIIEQQAGEEEDVSGEPHQMLSIKDQEEYLMKAIEAFDTACGIYDSVRYPGEHAILHINLGTAYALLSQVKQRIPNIRKALVLYKEGLSYFGKEFYPLTFSIITNNIGVAYYYLSDFGLKENYYDNAKKALVISGTTLEDNGFKNYLYEVRLNSKRMEQNIKAMSIFRDPTLSSDEKQTMLESLGARYQDDEIGLKKPEEPDTIHAREMEFLLLGISKIKL
ncbi:hypothetical protein ACFL3D_00100 [Candidatus Omnitrophota bacterium]